MFKKFPTLAYASDNKFVNVSDIFIRAAAIKESLDSFQLETYTIEDGENPEDVAFRLYNDPTLYWAVLLVNDIIDPINDWYLSSEVLEEFVKNKYGAEFLNTTHHWVLPDNPLICVEYNSAKLANGEIVAVSNLEHEELVNDEKQDIKVISPSYIRDFLKEFENLIRV